MSYPAGTMTVRGMKFDLQVTENGYWITFFQNSRVSSITLEGLEEELRKLTKKAAAKISVPFTVIMSRGYSGPLMPKHGTATGLHSGNGNVLVEWRNGQKGQFDTGYRSSDASYRRLTAEESDEIIRLRKAVSDATSALNEYEHPLRINLKTEVQKALEAAVQEDTSG